MTKTHPEEAGGVIQQEGAQSNQEPLVGSQSQAKQMKPRKPRIKKTAKKIQKKPKKKVADTKAKAKLK